MKSITFVDRAIVRVFAGDGGDGCAAFRRAKFEPKGGPFGGDGGRGGSVWLRASKDESSLLDLYYAPHIRAEHGESGRTKQQDGHKGEDRVVNVPCGTEIYDADTGDWLGEVIEDGDALCVARGGRGGLGNCHFATPVNRTPTQFTPGRPGEQFTLRLEMKSVAEVGLVGFPNAGKSTLIGAISSAHPRVAAYPFTTLHPTIGTVIFDDFTQVRVADIPGLIQGAHRGVGLGHAFLRHIERTSFLLVVLDMAATEGRDPGEDFRLLLDEMQRYDASLTERPRLVVANKMDEPAAAEHLQAFRRRHPDETILPVSAGLGEGLDALKAELKIRLERGELKPRVHAAPREELVDVSGPA